MKTRISLSVPYRDRHHAKDLGAYWDPVQVTWYITSDINPAPFQRWIKSPRSERVRLDRAYLLSRTTPCPRCHTDTKVFCLATRHLTTSPGQEKHVGFFTLFHINVLPGPFYRELHQHCLTYFMTNQHHSNTRLQNHCLCGAVIDDKVLHRPGPDSFRPLNEDQATQICCELLTLHVNGLIHCQWRSNPLLLAGLSEKTPVDIP